MGTVCTVRVLSTGTYTQHCYHSSPNHPHQQNVRHKAELPPGNRGLDQQANQHGAVRILRLSISAYFARTDIALHGFAERFRLASAEEKDHAEKLISYQILRGGRVTFQAINKPNLEDWGTAVEATEASLELERTVNESLLAMHKVAAGHEDAQMTDFIEGTFLKEQVEAIKEIGDL